MLPVSNNSDPRNNKKLDLTTLRVTPDTIELFVGDNWSAADHFLSATDSEGDPVEFKNISVNGIVDTIIAGTYTITYINGSLSVDVTVHVKEIPTGTIIDPTDLEMILEQGIENPEIGVLRLNYVSSFNFGTTKLSKSTQVYYTGLDTVITETSVEKKYQTLYQWKITVKLVEDGS